MLLVGCANRKPAKLPSDDKPSVIVEELKPVIIPHVTPMWVGVASWYDLPGRLTASGERYSRNALTCASRILPLGSWVEVIRLDTGARVVLRVNDRGPYAKGRAIDLSYAAAKRLGFVRRGLARVLIRLMGNGRMQ